MDDVTYGKLLICYDYLTEATKKKPDYLKYVRGYGYYFDGLRLGLDKYDAARRMRFMLGTPTNR